MNIVEKYCTGNNRYKAAQRYTPVGVVLHSIGTPQPKASALWNYWQNNGSQYVVHYMVDDTEILHCMPDNYKCWHVCSPGNDKYIGIEMGEPSQIKYTSGATFTVSDLAAAQAYCEKTYKNAVWLIAHLCKKYGWDPDTDVHTHYEITQRRLSNTDHVDPQHLWNGLGMGYDLATLKRDVKAAMSGSSSTSTGSSKPVLMVGSRGQDVYKLQSRLKELGYYPHTIDSVFGAKTKACVMQFQKEHNLVQDGIVGVLTWGALDSAQAKSTDVSTSYVVKITASALNVRSQPNTASSIVNVLSRGGAYTIVEERSGWGLLKAYSQKKNGWISLKYTKRI